jgi:RNA-directed DNA polymerase
MPRQRGLAQEGADDVRESLRSDELMSAIDNPEHSRWDELMEEVATHVNLATATKRVRKNRGSPGIDGMTVAELPAYMEQHEERLRRELLAGTYRPRPVRRKTIPKPGGGERELGIPTVVDRVVQQAILQVLGPRFEAGFSKHSHGFRPKHSAHGAVREAQRYIREGNVWVVDVDLERFFDRVNHDVLMSKLAKKIVDRRMLVVLRRFLDAGIMVNGVVIEREDGTPQGGPLSPLLANVMLDEIDQILETRGHRFVRYADDCNVYVRSRRAGERVMTLLRRELARLRLRINEAKSAVDRPSKRKFLGFTFRGPRIRISHQAIEKLKAHVRELTNRNRGAALPTVVNELTEYLRGWMGYFGICEVAASREGLDPWIRSRLRLLQLKQWIRGRTAYHKLVALGADEPAAVRTAQNLRRWWHAAHSVGAKLAMPPTYFDRLGLVRLLSS